MVAIAILFNRDLIPMPSLITCTYLEENEHNIDFQYHHRQILKPIHCNDLVGRDEWKHYYICLLPQVLSVFHRYFSVWPQFFVSLAAKVWSLGVLDEGKCPFVKTAKAVV